MRFTKVKLQTGYLLNEKWRKTFTVRPANAGTFIQFTQIPEKANHNIDQIMLTIN